MEKNFLLADIVNAETFLIFNNKVNFLTKSKIHFEVINSLKKLITQQSGSIYHVFGHTTGYVISVKVDSQKFICFAFDYTSSLPLYGQLSIVDQLTKIQQISQLIYSNYTDKIISNDKIIFHNMQSPESHVDNTASKFTFFEIETAIIKAIVCSRESELIAALNHLHYTSYFQNEDLSNQPLRHHKNFLIAYISVLNRAIGQWGYPLHLSSEIMNNLIVEIKRTKQINSLLYTTKGLAWYYYKLVRVFRTNQFLPLHTRIKSYIYENIYQNITLDDIAKSVHSSKKNLNPAFKKQYGSTIKKFIRNAKIERAKELLAVSDSKLSDVSK
ncbi:AraC family transcriptional regulator [Leuconostoc palmae]|uniref:AraC family transcriptional regulator n=1 Tax=Leuconostoc palmae TaxID=501487 RepID=UPI001C7CA7CE|nr:AraC family transcriptional regulator [Leuconostoc palmae]